MDRWISIGCDREDKTSQRPFEPKYNWKVDQGTINGKIWKWNQMEKIERNGNRIKWTWKNGKCNEMEKGNGKKWKWNWKEIKRYEKKEMERNGTGKKNRNRKEMDMKTNGKGKR
jgi:hypothetical protein